MARSKSQPVTLESYTAQLEDIVNSLNTEIEKLKTSGNKGVKFLKSIRNSVLVAKKRAPKLAKQKRRKSPNAKSGFKIPHNVSDELRSFLKLKKGDQISRVDTTRALTVYIHLKTDEKREAILKWARLNPEGKRNLQSATDGTIILPDAKLKKLLRFDEYVKAVKAGKVMCRRKNKETKEVEERLQEDTNLHYYTIQKLIQHHFLKN